MGFGKQLFPRNSIQLRNSFRGFEPVKNFLQNFFLREYNENIHYMESAIAKGEPMSSSNFDMEFHIAKYGTKYT